LSKHHAVVDALVVVADVKPGDIGVLVGQPLGKAHGSLDATVALEVTAAGAENQLLLQAGFVEPDDLSAVVSPADIVVSVLTPSVLELQGHTGIRTEPGWALPCLGESSKVVPEPTALRVTPFLCCLNAAFGPMCFVVGLPVALPTQYPNRPR
jgi:hypothetical protein